MFVHQLVQANYKINKKVTLHWSTATGIHRWQANSTNALQGRYTGRDGFSNHQPHHCLLNCLFGCRSTKTSKLRVTCFCARNSPVTGEFPAQMALTRKTVPFDDVIMNPPVMWKAFSWDDIIKSRCHLRNTKGKPVKTGTPSRRQLRLPVWNDVWNVLLSRENHHGVFEL